MEHGAKLDMKIGGSYNHRDANSGGTQFDSSNALALITTTSSTSSDKNLTASGKFSTPIVEGHALATGWDGAFSKRDEVRLTTEVSPTGLIPQNIDEALRACVRRLALFAQDEWNVTARWSVYFGLRWEGIETIAGATGLADIENRSSVWSPLFQTLWKLPDSKADQLRFALTRTYKAPNTGSLVPRHYSSRENTPTTPDYQGNPNLKPELAWGLDLGLEHFIEGGGVLSGSTFARRIDDITHQQTTLIGDRWVSMIGNGGVANTYGIEMDFKLPLRSVDKTAPNIDLRANMTRSWSSLSTVPGPNNRLDSQTPFSGTIGADYKMDGTGPLSTGASYSFQGAGAVRTSFNQYGWSRPRRSLDMYAAWKFDPKNQLRVSISNLLHQTSITENSYVDTNGVAGRRSESPSTTTLRAIMEIKL
jgi:outer membrane receptor protein involved in Fe transport